MSDGEDVSARQFGASFKGFLDEIQIPPPDPACRQRLLSLYSAGLTVELKDEAKIIERTKGASAAFEEAPSELVAQGGELTKSLLGFAAPAAD
jgi:hypothetical protein